MQKGVFKPLVIEVQLKRFLELIPSSAPIIFGRTADHPNTVGSQDQADHFNPQGRPNAYPNPSALLGHHTNRRSKIVLVVGDVPRTIHFDSAVFEIITPPKAIPCALRGARSRYRRGGEVFTGLGDRGTSWGRAAGNAAKAQGRYDQPGA